MQNIKYFWTSVVRATFVQHVPVYIFIPELFVHYYWTCSLALYMSADANNRKYPDWLKSQYGLRARSRTRRRTIIREAYLEKYIGYIHTYLCHDFTFESKAHCMYRIHYLFYNANSDQVRQMLVYELISCRNVSINLTQNLFLHISIQLCF